MLAVAAGPFAGPVAPASAGVGLAATVSFPSPVTVGATGLPATLQITNVATPPDSDDPVVIEAVFPGVPAISLVPSCGNAFGSGTGDCSSADPGVFALSASGTGEADTACAGVVFTNTVVDPGTGKMSFTPSTPVVLQPPGSPGDTCRVNFTFDVLRRPTIDSQPAPGVQTSQIASATGRNTTTNTAGSGTGSSNATVLEATSATIATSATPNITIGGVISDTATVTGSPAPVPMPTGTVVFHLFGPDNPTCAGVPIFTSAPQALAGGPPPTAVSGPFTPTSPGSYNWVAVYSGDANYAPVTGLCGDPNETSVVNQAVATIVSQATPVVTIGSPITDTATVTGTTGAPGPTGTATFVLFGPDDATCSGPPIFNSGPRPLTPGGGGPPPTGTANSGSFTPTAAGTYRWIATYGGDAFYGPVTSPCNAANESSVVSQAVATITTQATPSVTIGSPISDTATVTGAPAPAPIPTGTVTFTVYGPGNPTCTGAPVFTSSVPLAGGPPPTATSGNFTPTSVGSYNWVAVYNGDANHPSVTSPCGAPDETSVVTQAPQATITSQATASAPLGQPISDTATVAGPPDAPTPTGTVTFTVFGPDDATCSGAPAFTSAPQALAGGPPPTATSGSFAPTAAGAYRWIVAYSGDPAYPASTTACNEPNETSLVLAPGELRVTTTPPLPSQILLDGIPRDSYGLAWLKLAPGDYVLSFTHVEGWTEPAPRTVTVVAGAVTTVDGIFAQRAMLEVVTSPPVPGTISVDGVPRDDWGVFTDLPPGSHQVCFGPVAGFDPPSCQTVNLVAGVSTLVTGNYAVNAIATGPTNVGLLRVLSSPALASQILVDGVPRDTWGLEWLALPPGSYTVSFSHVEGWTEPAPSTVDVTDGVTTTVTGAFTQRGSLEVKTDPAQPGTISVDGIPRNNWGMWTDLPVGTHEVCFGPVPGFLPACESTTLSAGTKTTVTHTYLAG